MKNHKLPCFLGTALSVVGLGLLPLHAEVVDRQQPSPSTSAAAAGDRASDADRADEVEVINDSIAVLNELTATPENGIPKHLLERAEAIVVIPSLIKGGFIVGAKHGKGVMSTRTGVTRAWSAPAFVNMSGGSIGWQIGAQSVDLVLLVMNKQGVTDLLEDKFTIGGTASIAAGPVGRAAQASTDAQFGAQILAYSRARGLFAGAAFEGAKLHADDSDIEDFYGREYKVDEVVGGKVTGQMPAAAETWKSAVTRATGGQ
jgi:lipid-binding SYLF domain-containing protein